jgi:UDP-N-acetylmuramyl pentapeptide phosphotransferase/UDP-N-acetylglucosamine-1-phosphate transferase
VTSRTVGALLIAVGAAVVWSLLLTRVPRPRAVNHRGREIPVTLGIAFVLATLAGAARSGFDGIPGSVIAAVLLVAAAGFLDDWRGSEERGIRAHLGSLAQGRFTTGILKILAGFAGGLMAVLALGGSPARQLAGVFLIAAATNLGNVLDVAPARVVKFFLPVQALVLWRAWDHPSAVLVAASLGAALGVLVPDLRERAMLGDAGSNALGFLAGVGLYVVLPTWALAGALGFVLLLQVLAETITLSRVIGSIPPLRWYDRAGRPGGGRETKSSRDPG